MLNVRPVVCFNDRRRLCPRGKPDSLEVHSSVAPTDQTIVRSDLVSGHFLYVIPVGRLAVRSSGLPPRHPSSLLLIVRHRLKLEALCY